MGIKDLRPFIGRKMYENNFAINALPWIRLSALAHLYPGKVNRVAIDTNFRVCSHMSTVYNMLLNNVQEPPLDGRLDEKQVVDHLIVQLARDAIKFLEVGMVPIFCFDGPPHPAKELTREKRKSTRKETRERMEGNLRELRMMKEQYQMIPPHLRIKYQELCEAIKKDMPNCAYLSDDGYEIVKSWLYVAGLPYLMAEHEAEKLCSLLCCDGIASVVFSSDGDCLPFGSHRTIYEPLEKVQLPGGQNDYMVHIMDLSAVMQLFKFTFPQLQDFCFMCETDFNERIDKVGPVRAYDMILKYGSIYQAWQHEGTKKDFSVLNYQVVSEIFKVVPWYEYVTSDADGKQKGEPFRTDIDFQMREDKINLIRFHGWNEHLFGIRFYLEKKVNPSPLPVELLQSSYQMLFSMLSRKTAEQQAEITKKMTRNQKGKTTNTQDENAYLQQRMSQLVLQHQQLPIQQQYY